MTLPTTTVTANSHFCWRDRRSQTATAMTRLRMIAYWATREMSESIAAVYVCTRSQEPQTDGLPPIRANVALRPLSRMTGRGAAWMVGLRRSAVIGLLVAGLIGVVLALAGLPAGPSLLGESSRHERGDLGLRRHLAAHHDVAVDD